METKDLIIRKAVFEDWPAIWRNVWSQEETARYMLWDVTQTEEAAVDRMIRACGFRHTGQQMWSYAHHEKQYLLECFVKEKTE